MGDHSHQLPRRVVRCRARRLSGVREDCYGLKHWFLFEHGRSVRIVACVWYQLTPVHSWVQQYDSLVGSDLQRVGSLGYSAPFADLRDTTDHINTFSGNRYVAQDLAPEFT